MAKRIVADGNALLTTKALPVGFQIKRLKASEARAYYHLLPYPTYGLFREWKEAERGPLPRCWSLPKKVVDESARWLFGRQLKLSVEEDGKEEKATKWITDLWEKNRMPVRMLQATKKAGYEGGVVLGWSYDKDQKDFPVKITTYSPVEHCRMYYDPHDDSRLIMVRVQYPYFDSGANKWFLYREDWTATKYVRFKPKPIESLWRGDWAANTQSHVLHFDETAVWEGEVDFEEKNAAGVIPFREIRHIDGGRGYGEGDLWHHTRLTDQYNLTRYLENVDNQISAWPHRIYIDLIAEGGEEPQAVGPDAVERDLRLRRRLFQLS